MQIFVKLFYVCVIIEETVCNTAIVQYLFQDKEHEIRILSHGNTKPSKT